LSCQAVCFRRLIQPWSVRDQRAFRLLDSAKDPPCGGVVSVGSRSDRKCVFGR
jgi:hypothetical protein